MTHKSIFSNSACLKKMFSTVHNIGVIHNNSQAVFIQTEHTQRTGNPHATIQKGHDYTEHSKHPVIPLLNLVIVYGDDTQTCEGWRSRIIPFCLLSRYIMEGICTICQRRQLRYTLCRTQRHTSTLPCFFCLYITTRTPLFFHSC
jgi:hypothetical protein